MEVVLGQILGVVFGVVSHGHHQMGWLRMMGWRMGKSDDEIGCVEVIDEIGLNCLN